MTTTAKATAAETILAINLGKYKSVAVPPVPRKPVLGSDHDILGTGQRVQ